MPSPDDLPTSPREPATSSGAGPDPYDWARQIVLRQLTAGPRSRTQLELALRRRRCPPGVAAAVLGRMAEVGLVDDTAYADMLIRSRHVGRGLARRALIHELRRAGIDEGTARHALDRVDPHAEEERARELVAKKLRTMVGLDPLVQTRRLARLLARKGYDSDVALRVVGDAVREAPEHQRD